MSGLKLAICEMAKLTYTVSPYTGEWIEIKKGDKGEQGIQSHLTQVSGLKY